MELFAGLAGLFALVCFIAGLYLGDQIRVSNLIVTTWRQPRRPVDLDGRSYYVIPAHEYYRLTGQALMTILDEEEE